MTINQALVDINDADNAAKKLLVPHQYSQIHTPLARANVILKGLNVLPGAPNNPGSPGIVPFGSVPQSLVGANQLNALFPGTTLDETLWTPYWFVDNSGVMNDVVTSSADVSVAGGLVKCQVSSAPGSGNGVGGLISSNPTDGVSGHTGFEFLHGYLEFLCTMPGPTDTDNWNWPAAWAVTVQGAPADKYEEFDLFEGLGSMTWNYHQESGQSGPFSLSGNLVNSEHYVGAFIERTSQGDANDQVTFFLDGVQQGSAVPTLSGGDAELYCIFNQGINGGASNQTGATGAATCAHVRQWLPA